MTPRRRKPPESTEVLSHIPLDKILEPDIPMRITIDQDDLVALSQSIQEHGQQEPGKVAPRGDKFVIVFGHRRFLACRMARKATFAAIVEELKDEEITVLQLIENVDRAGVTPLEEALHLGKLIKEHNWTQAIISKRVCKSEAWVSQRLAILDYPETLMTALQNKDVTFSVARELARIENPDYMQTYLNWARDGGATPAIVKRWIDDYLQTLNDAPGASPPSSPPEILQEQQFIGQECSICGQKKSFSQLRSTWLCHDDFQIMKALRDDLEKGNPRHESQ